MSSVFLRSFYFVIMFLFFSNANAKKKKHSYDIESTTSYRSMILTLLLFN